MSIVAGPGIVMTIVMLRACPVSVAQKREKAALPPRSEEYAYDDVASLVGVNFAPEKF